MNSNKKTVKKKQNGADGPSWAFLFTAFFRVQLDADSSESDVSGRGAHGCQAESAQNASALMHRSSLRLFFERTIASATSG
jgi:hypothetical protein